jgi:hypothetical protein
MVLSIVGCGASRAAVTVMSAVTAVAADTVGSALGCVCADVGGSGVTDAVVAADVAVADAGGAATAGAAVRDRAVRVASSSIGIRVKELRHFGHCPLPPRAWSGTRVFCPQ